MLAKIQARIVGRQLEEHFPNREIEYHTATASADRNMDINIADSNSVGLFTKDISNKIINNKFDINFESDRTKKSIVNIKKDIKKLA